jgi:hypothetical protein
MTPRGRARITGDLALFAGLYVLALALLGARGDWFSLVFGMALGIVLAIMMRGPEF